MLHVHVEDTTEDTLGLSIQRGIAPPSRISHSLSARTAPKDASHPTGTETATSIAFGNCSSDP